MNQCGACSEDFAGVRDFDSHRVGKHDYLWSLDQEDGRRCLHPSEMIEAGWKQNTYGRWVHARQARRRVVFAPERVAGAK
jgi:hypothetical protein